METPSTFKIVEPCHENWNSMTAESQGRFCASCQRCVIDFSNKSRTEMKEIYDREGGDVCGRVKVSQLVSPRPAVRATFSLRRNGLKSLQLFALALMAAFTLMFSSPAKAQDGPRMVMGKMEYVAPTARLEGKVTWDSGESASGVTVRMSQNGTLVATTVTDDQGRFSFAQRHGGEYTVAVEAGHGTHATETIELK
ncbi:MAG TPA: carboxypeptidase-like regulatory domain-containing protein, partial [Bacteroidia bacterium]|nr:carboxypeptidase-like regulatory domain-containing protein [Bacteroidia bacterium]